MLNPKDYYFKVYNTAFFLVSKKYWAEHKHVECKTFDTSLLEGILPLWVGDLNKVTKNGFSQTAESMFVYYEGYTAKFKKGKALLLEAGFEEIK